MDSTGNTHGIRFGIRPPRKANTSMVSRLASMAVAPSPAFLRVQSERCRHLRQQSGTRRPRAPRNRHPVAFHSQQSGLRKWICGAILKLASWVRFGRPARPTVRRDPQRGRSMTRQREEQIPPLTGQIIALQHQHQLITKTRRSRQDRWHAAQPQARPDHPECVFRFRLCADIHRQGEFAGLGYAGSSQTCQSATTLRSVSARNPATPSPAWRAQPRHDSRSP